jgi:hypothetical protein
VRNGNGLVSQDLHQSMTIETTKGEIGRLNVTKVSEL